MTFASVLVLQVTLNHASNVNFSIIEGVDFLLIPILALFVSSIFWRSAVQTFLSLVGALLTYGGMFFFYAVNSSSPVVSTFIASRLGYGIKHITVIIPNSVADIYFIIGIFALVFCLSMAIKSNFFKPKDRELFLSSMES